MNTAKSILLSFAILMSVSSCSDEPVNHRSPHNSATPIATKTTMPPPQDKPEQAPKPTAEGLALATDDKKKKQVKKAATPAKKVAKKKAATPVKKAVKKATRK